MADTKNDKPESPENEPEKAEADKPEAAEPETQEASTKSKSPSTKTKGKKKKGSASAKARVKEPKKKSSPADEPDEFIATANKWATALKPHAIKIAVIVGMAAVLLIGWAVHNWLGQRKAAKWTEAYGDVVEISAQPVVEPPSTDGGVPDVEPDSFPSSKARAEAVLAAAGGVHGNEGVDAATALIRARQLMILGRFDEAAKAFAKVSQSDLPAAVQLSAREGIGYAYEAKAETIEGAEERKQILEQALQAFVEMQPAESGPRRDWSMYHQARVLAILGKTDEARAMYEKILTTLPDSELKPQIEVRMVGLKK